MTATKFLDIVSRLPGCCGEDSDATSAYTQIILENANKLLGTGTIPKTYVSLPRNKWPASWRGMNEPVVELKRNLYGHPLAGLLWDKASERWITKQGFKKVQGWECLYYHSEEQLFLGVYVDDFHMAGNKKNMSKMWDRL